MASIRRVIKNTGFQYIRMIVSVAISLISVRLILQALGEEDFGIFSLIGSVVVMFSFLNGAMAISMQRYLAFFMGRGEINKQKIIFQTGIVLHILIGLVVVVLLELIGLFIFDGFLNIPEHRIPTAKIVYQLSIIGAFFTINSIPFDSSISAHEDFLFDAITGIIESIFKLIIAIWLLHYNHDKLILYSVFVAVLIILIRIAKSIFCSVRYQECTLKGFAIYHEELREMSSFASWNTFGAACSVAKNQGLGIVLNIFHSVVINTAYGIAQQVNWQLMSFSENMLKAIRPQILKSGGQNDHGQMISLIILASKFGFFLLAFFAIPIIFEMKYILTLWLKEIPPYTIIFCQLLLISSLINMFTIGIQTGLQAIGKVKLYLSFTGSLILLNLPLAWIILSMDYPPYAVIVASLIIELFASCLRLYFAKKYYDINISKYLKEVFLRTLIPTLLTVFITWFFVALLNEGLLRFMITTAISSVIFVLLVFISGFEIAERKRLLEFIRLKLSKSNKTPDEH